MKRYIEKKAEKDNKTEDAVFDEYVTTRDIAADKGTDLHKEIEVFLENRTIPKIISHEFNLFLKFYGNKIITEKIKFYEAEKMIISKEYNVAGTIDCLFKKQDIDEYVMYDWKRSKKVAINGRPRIFGYGFALSELNHLDNSSYNRYCLQQNIYKYILEKEYGIKISSMWLVVLHENYPTYYNFKVPERLKEAEIILKSLKTKI